MMSSRNYESVKPPLSEARFLFLGRAGESVVESLALVDDDDLCAFLQSLLDGGAVNLGTLT